MSQTRSGYVVEIPLGLGAQLRFEFEPTVDGPTDFAEVLVWLDDGDDLHRVPAQLEPLVQSYVKTWLLEENYTTGAYRPQAWIARAHWVELTVARLECLEKEGQAHWEDDLDD